MTPLVPGQPLVPNRGYLSYLRPFRSSRAASCLSRSSDHGRFFVSPYLYSLDGAADNERDWHATPELYAGHCRSGLNNATRCDSMSSGLDVDSTAYRLLPLSAGRKCRNVNVVAGAVSSPYRIAFVESS